VPAVRLLAGVARRLPGVPLLEPRAKGLRRERPVVLPPALLLAGGVRRVATFFVLLVLADRRTHEPPWLAVPALLAAARLVTFRGMLSS
jgi:hypothetical protein